MSQETVQQRVLWLLKRLHRSDTYFFNSHSTEKKHGYFWSQSERDMYFYNRKGQLIFKYIDNPCQRHISLIWLVDTICKYLSNQLLLCIPIAHAVVQTTLMAHLDSCKKALNRSRYIYFGSLRAVRLFNKSLNMPHTFSAHQIHQLLSTSNCIKNH